MHYLSNILSDQQIAELIANRSSTDKLTKAGVSKGIDNLNDLDTKVNYNIRNTLVDEINHEDFPEISNAISKEVSRLFSVDVSVNQADYLFYEKGMFFAKHQDVTIREDGGRLQPRVFTTITMLNKSDDFDGGELLLHDEHAIYDLDVGETVIFRSEVHHEVKPVLSGTREVLVTWLA